MTSFQRQLSLYGFKRVLNGPDAGAYYHPEFIRDDPEKAKDIKRIAVMSPEALVQLYDFDYKLNTNFPSQSATNSKSRTTTSSSSRARIDKRKAASPIPIKKPSTTASYSSNRGQSSFSSFAILGRRSRSQASIPVTNAVAVSTSNKKRSTSRRVIEHEEIETDTAEEEERAPDGSSQEFEEDEFWDAIEGENDESGEQMAITTDIRAPFLARDSVAAAGTRDSDGDEDDMSSHLKMSGGIKGSDDMLGFDAGSLAELNSFYLTTSQPLPHSMSSPVIGAVTFDEVRVTPEDPPSTASNRTMAELIPSDSATQMTGVGADVGATSGDSSDLRVGIESMPKVETSSGGEGESNRRQSNASGTNDSDERIIDVLATLTDY